MLVNSICVAFRCTNVCSGMFNYVVL